MYDETRLPSSPLPLLSHDAAGIALLITDALQDGICVLDGDNRILFANDSFRRHTCRSAEDLIGSPYLELIHPDDRERAARALGAACSGRPSLNIVHRKRAGKAPETWWTSSWTPLFGDAGCQIGVLAQETSLHGRQKAEEALRRSEERYRRIAEAVTDYIYTISLGPAQEYATSTCPACEAVTGYGAREFDADPDLWTAISPEEDRPSVRSHAERLRRGDDAGMIRHRILRKDGTVRWISRQAVPHHGPDGRVRSYDVLVRDITDQRQAELALRESESRFRHMADLLPQPLFEYDVRGRITFSNRAASDMFGYDADDMRRGLTAPDLLAPEDRDRANANIRNIQDRRPDQGNEYLARRKDGTTFPVIVFSASIVRNERPDGVRSIVVDITERVQAEEVLRGVALKFRQLAESISEVFFIKDARTRHTLYISPAYETIWGRSCQSFYEQPESFRDAVHPDDRETVVDTLRRQGTGMPTSCEYRIIRPDGALRWIRSKTFPVRDGGGALYRIVGVAEDITERKEAEEALSVHAAQLRALSSRLVEVREAERRSIARELHDEIGQLATGIKLGLDFLVQAVPDGAAEQAGRLQVMTAELIEEIRNLSLGLRPSMLDDLGLLPALAWLFKRFTAQTGIAVDLSHRDISRRFPADVETVAYRAVQEAITNVARHAETDQIAVDLRLEDRRLVISISDNGQGFQPDQVLSATQSIGLFGMRERVDSIGGSLTIRSAPGAGTTIMLSLPLANDAA